MLVQFSVQNFKSIGHRQTLSMAASASASRRERVCLKTGNSFSPYVLRSAVIFGPNASGKSSFIDAVNFFKNFVTTSAQFMTKGETIPLHANQFVSELRGQPSEFEATFLVDGTLYQYGFSATEERVMGEWLFSRYNVPRSKMITLFQREYDKKDDSQVWFFNESQVRGEKETWKSSTRDNALFLSTAVQLNSEFFEKPFSWIQRHLQVIRSPDRIHPSYTAEMILDKKYTDQIQKFMEASGLKIDGFKVEKKELEFPENFGEFFTAKAKETFLVNIKSEMVHRIEATHLDDSGKKIDLPLSQESDGSKVLFSLAGPILDVLEDGDILFVDELNNSLHPAALKFLVGLFHDPEVNQNGAQLIFTSHDASIISNQFMHKSQIWFMEKQNGIYSELFPLTDFKVRDVDAFQRAYLGGKFGALPNIGRLNHGWSK